MQAFQMAKQMGCGFVEFDVTMTRDEEVVVIHDDTLDRTTNGHGQVSDVCWADIQTLDAGSWFAPSFYEAKVSSLKEVIGYLNEAEMFASVEIKTLPRPVLALKVIDIVEQHWSRARPWPLISSFDYSTLCVCHQR